MREKNVDGVHGAIIYGVTDGFFASIKGYVAMRARRRIYNKFCSIFPPKESDSIIDMGVTPNECVKHANFLERWYPYTTRLTAASIEDASYFEKRYAGLKFLKLKHNRENRFINETTGEPIPDNAFDVLFCSAVLEHVGSRDQQKKFIAECIRIAPKCFITTPDRHFLFEMHTIIPILHWLPMNVFRKFLRFIGKDFLADERNLNLFTINELKHMMCEPPPPPASQAAEGRGLEKTLVQFFRLRIFFWPSNIMMVITRT
jgi:hypothetical protein